MIENDTGIDDLFMIETVEQMRAIADELRQRILSALIEQPMTVTQLGQLLQVAPAKAHYHVREMEKVGVVRLVETREKGGILEKYYRTVARSIQVSPALLRGPAADEALDTVADFLQEVVQRFTRAIGRAMRDEPNAGQGIALNQSHIWVTEEELRDLEAQIAAVVQPYERPRGVEGETELSTLLLIYPSVQREESELPTIRRMVTVGVTDFSRAELEKCLARGERLDISVIGACYFHDDVPADLADKVVVRFRMRGPLLAPAAVREVLKCKEAATVEG